MLPLFTATLGAATSPPQINPPLNGEVIHVLAGVWVIVGFVVIACAIKYMTKG